MLLRLKKWRKIKQSALIVPWQDKDPKSGAVKAHGHLHFSKIGDEREIDDKIGYSILAKYDDMLEIAGGEKPEGAKTKKASSPSNK